MNKTDLFQLIFINPFWVKMASCLALYLIITKHDQTKKFLHLKYFRIILITVVSSEILIAGLDLFSLNRIVPVIYFVQQLIIVLVYLKILTTFNSKNYTSFIFYFANILGLLICSLLIPFELPWFFQYFPGVFILANWIYAAYAYYQISEYNTERSEVIMESRKSIFKNTIILQSIVLAIFIPWGGYLNLFVQVIIIPLTYAIHPWILMYWERNAEGLLFKKAKTAQKNMDSLLEFMNAIGNAISEQLAMDEVLNFVVKSAVKSAYADGGAVFLVDEFDDVLRVKAVEGDFPPPYQVPEKVKLKISTLLDYFKSTPIPIGKTIVGECARTGKFIYVKDSSVEPRLASNSKLDQIYISSMIIVPLMQGKKVFGVMALVSRRGNYQFTEDQAEQIKTFGDYTSLTINSLYTYLQIVEKQEMEKEVGIAADIQGHLLPSRLPQTSSIAVSVYSLPAKGVSGDYYDIINIRKGQILAAMCDVAGKGVPASLVMVMIRTIIHLVAHQKNITVNKILDIVNWGIAGNISLERFATMALFSYDFQSHTLEYSNAAHHPLLIYRKKNNFFESLDTEGIPIGLERKTRYNLKKIILSQGDLVILYTDGIIEAMNDRNEQYTLEALQKVIAQNCDLAPDKLKKVIIDDLTAFVGKAKQHDDQTFLLMKVEN